MLDFPNSPVIDQTYQGPSGQLWRWTGNMWSAVRRPVLGVTDGSNAAPGEVGEVIAFSGTVTLAQAWTTAASITLTAGDWDVSCWLFIPSQTGFSQGLVAATLSATPGQSSSFGYQWFLPSAGTSFQFAASGGPVRINTATAMSVYMNVYVLNGSWGGCLVRLQARRMR